MRDDVGPMSLFLQRCFDSLANGSVYAGLAVALSMVFRSTGVLNLAQGQMATVSAYIAYLFASDRWEHVYGHGGIIDHHDAGDVVICDRYYYSSLVYQSIQGDGALVSALNQRFPDPGLVIFVDLATDLGEQRLAGRRHREIYEHREFQTQVRRNYLREMEIAREFTAVASVSGSDSEAEVHRKIWEAVVSASILKA